MSDVAADSPDVARARELRGATSVVGVGYTPFMKHSGMSTLGLAVEAITAAVADAGLSVADVDGLATHHVNDSAPLNEVAVALGRDELSWFHDELGGGSKAPAVVGHAALALVGGAAECVVVYRALNGRSGVRMGGSGSGGRTIAASDVQYQRPYGLLSPVQAYAMGARMHMNRFGTTYEHLGAVAVQQRQNAMGNERAVMREPITMEDYLASRWVAEPFRLLDCCLETDGACAVVLTRTDRARDLRQPVVAIQAWAQALGPNDFSSSDGDLTRTPAGRVAPRLYRRAGLGPGDVDVAELYDAFTIAVLLQLEAYGFCDPGESGPLVASGATALHGSLPVNTHGGFLSEGYVHGLNHICEAVLQLRGQAGDRQVPGCEVALSTAQPGYLTGLSSALLLTRS
jgi:acetyl-CoA acetyltransferase